MLKYLLQYQVIKQKMCKNKKKCANYGEWYIFKKPLPCWNPIWLPWGCSSWHSGVSVGWGQRCQGPPYCRTAVWFQGWLKVCCSWGIGLQLLLELIHIGEGGRKSGLPLCQSCWCSRILQLTWFWSCSSWCCWGVPSYPGGWHEGEHQLHRVIASGQGESVKDGGQPGVEIIGLANPVGSDEFGGLEIGGRCWVGVV